jgi:signal transduction histidine kinase
MADGAPVSIRERVLLELARREKSDTKAMFAAITEATSAVLGVERVSIWQLQTEETRSANPDTQLVCKDLYLASSRHHGSFAPIHGRDFPCYLRAIRERRTITASDAQKDPRTAEFTAFYLKPLGITSMLDVPIWHGGKLYGVLCLEHVGESRQWRWDEEDFAINMTDLAASSLEAAHGLLTSRRWSAVVESLSEAVVVMDPCGRVVQCNSAGYRLFRDEDHHIRDRTEFVDEVELVDAADRPVPDNDWPLPRVRRSELVRGEIYGVRFKRTGERRYIRVTCSPVCETDCVVSSYVLVADDATEDVLVERLKRELLSGLAHELKTPLAIAKGYAQQLASRRELPPSHSRMLDAIVHACDRMDHLTETMIDLASVILGRLCLTRERLDFVELVRSIARRSEQAVPDRKIELTTEVEAPVPVVVDGARIAQAVRHLIENALNYSAQDHPVELEITADADKVTLTVGDHGIGFPAKLKARVFSPFFRAHAGTVHDRGGLGIGLYLAREILLRHGGDITFESEEGKGSTFRLTLPRAGGM